MGNLYRRGGVWYADYYDRAGERHRCSTHTRDHEVARSKLRDLELQTTDRGSNQTEDLSDSLDYFTDIVCAGRSAGTVRCYKQKACHVSRLIGCVALDRLNRETVERYIATRLGEGAHRHSVHKELVVLRGALTSAKGRDRFHGSMDVVPKFKSGYEPRTAYLTPDQFLAFVQHLVPEADPKATDATKAKLERRMQSRALYSMLIALASPRRGELEALDWSNIDLARGVLRIPKGKTVGRPIAIHPVLRPWLEAFERDAGPVIEPWSNVTRDMEIAAKRAGVPKVTPNDLRRTFASWLVQAGTSLLVVSRLLGHNSTRMVDMVYGQLDEATLMAAIGNLPGCDAGVTRTLPNRGTGGAGGTSNAPLSIVNSVEESMNSAVSVVPRGGIEPSTRGFSGLVKLAPERRDSKRLLRSVK